MVKSGRILGTGVLATDLTLQRGQVLALEAENQALKALLENLEMAAGRLLRE